MTEQEIYLISELGADQRLFSRLNLPNHRLHPIEWVEPLADESLPAYSKRLVNQVKPNSGVILIGVSFGGIIAIELARLINVTKIILISSIKATHEKPWYFAVFRNLGLHRIMSSKLLQFLLKLTRPMFGRMTDDEYRLFISMVQETSAEFMRWGIEAVLNWQAPVTDTEIVHIHGDRDLIFPVRKVASPEIIRGGNHFMIIQKAEEISAIVNQVLA